MRDPLKPCQKVIKIEYRVLTFSYTFMYMLHNPLLCQISQSSTPATSKHTSADDVFAVLTQPWIVSLNRDTSSKTLS